MQKMQEIGHFDFFSAIVEHARELVISNMHNKFGKAIWKKLKSLCPQAKVNKDANADADDSMAISYLFKLKCGLKMLSESR